jgi:glycosyltransferase involved in cell wall biosynthesis
MAGRIKILVNAIPLNNIGTGIGRYLKCLYTELEKFYGDRLEIRYFDGANVSSTMPRGPENQARWSKGVDLFWKLPAYPALLLRLGIHYKREMIFYRLAKDFDIYHEAGFFPFAVPPRVKTVFTLHDLSVILFPEHHPLERVFYYRLFFRKRCKKVDHFLTVSRFTQTEMERLLDIESKNISVTHLAHDPKLFYPKPEKEVNRFLVGKGLPERYFLFVGSGDPRKNMDIIPKALEKAGLCEPLVVSGWSGWSDRMSWNNVIPLGYISDEDLACLYSGALALILPSSYEGFGLPLLEAMACGCPVVAAKEASLPEVAKDAALYIKSPRDIESLAGILEHLASTPDVRRKLIKKGLKRAREFSWSHTARSTFQAFERVLEK